jgi:hypothetical protein
LMLHLELLRKDVLDWRYSRRLSSPGEVIQDVQVS